ncbi:hypothetical protein IV460_11140 [Enterococcus casseliflavus]|uniref:hypothetical protein n=1 Tax=Enterococcus casseliflavus TaxID=37734 RepID=UPI001E2AB606|nr:hypothetical protein [Enterococcus casseliflavus]MCD5190677.1 hypothetical protein [Enterococcus casseliflavus]MCD5191609.1 hypothetical protein [Enterococcus casseliflavus]
MSEKLSKAVNNVYKFTIIEEDGKNKIQPPQMDLPESVKERIKFFGKYAEDGLSFLGCINLILAEDEEKCKKDFEIGAYEEYLPATEEFKEWRDDLAVRSLHQMEIAVALIYGTGEDQEAEL